MREDSLEDSLRIYSRSISWKENLNLSFCVSSYDDTGDLVDNLLFFLKDNVEKKIDEEEDDDKKYIADNVKVLDVSYFHPDVYYENSKKLLQEMDEENNLYIIDCTKVDKDNYKGRSCGNLSNFYYLSKDKKASFLYVYNIEGYRNYGVGTEPFQFRDSSYLSEKDDDLKTYRLFKEMSAKYENKESKKEKKSKI